MDTFKDYVARLKREVRLGQLTRHQAVRQIMSDYHMSWDDADTSFLLSS